MGQPHPFLPSINADVKPKHLLVSKLYPSFIQMGIISLMLTVANVVMVAIGSALMFRAKEVLPVKKKVFWSDLKVSQSLMCNLESCLFY